MNAKTTANLGIIAALIASLLLCGISRADKAPAVPAGAARYVIGLSPFLQDSVKDDVYRRIIGFLLEDLPLDSSLEIYDAYRVQSVAEADVPNVRAFSSGKTRANRFKEQIYQLKRFLAARPRARGGAAAREQAIRFPQFMEFISENLIRPGQRLAVLIVGSPLYLDDKEPEFSMVDGYFPSDGHLLASRDQSVFGIKGRAGALAGAVVHWAYFGDPWVSDVHHEKVERFWRLYLKGQGARLGAFCGDLATVFQAARENRVATMPEDDALRPGPTKIQMLRVARNIGAADWITQEVIPGDSPPPTSAIGPMKIGIRWKGKIDLDLYAARDPRAEALFFQHTRSSDGYYFKDYRSSPEGEYEYVAFETPVDARQVAALVNFYDGAVRGAASGEVRVEFRGQVYSSHFSIPSDHGNQGRAGPSQRAFWTRIDIARALGLDRTP